MSIFDIIKNHSDGSANANSANSAKDEADKTPILAELAELALATATPLRVKTEIPDLDALLEKVAPVIVAERIALKFETETPAERGNPVTVGRGHVLACENDPPVVRVDSWCLVNPPPGKALPPDFQKAAKDCRMSAQEAGIQSPGWSTG